MYNELKKLKKDMYQAKRFQMYIILLRISFTIFIAGLTIFQTVSAIINADMNIIGIIILITFAYIVNIIAYHVCMNMATDYYNNCKSIYEQKYSEYKDKLSCETTETT